MSDYEALQRSLSEQLPVVTYANRYAALTETLWMSSQVELLTGYRVEDWVGRPGFFETVLHPDDRAPVLAAMRASRDEAQPFSRDYRLITRDGRVLWIHDESVPVVDAKGKPDLIQGYFVDITERKDLEQQLLHAHRLEGIGRLAGGVAHDFNNFLMAIGGYASLALRALPSASPAGRHLHDLLQTVEAATRLTRQLLTFGRASEAAPQLVDLSQLVEEMRPMLRHVAGDWVRLSVETAATPPVHADVSELEQVVLNLVANARDADAGAITVLSGTDESHVFLAVSDDGSGMDETTRVRAFDPFFSTKEREHGSGLGLSIVHRIVTSAGGVVELETAPGKGTTVTVRLPRAPVG